MTNPHITYFRRHITCQTARMGGFGRHIHRK